MSEDYINWHLIELNSSTPLSLLKEAWRYQLPVEDSNETEEVNLPLTILDLLETLIVMQKHLTEFLQLMLMMWPLLMSFSVPYVGDLRGLNHIQSRKHFISGTFFDLLLSHTSYYVHHYTPCSSPFLYDEEGSHMENCNYLSNLGIVINEEQFLTQVDSKFYLDNKTKWSLIYLGPRNRDQHKWSANWAK